MLRQTATDLTHCWNQVSDEDAYVATQEWRINMVIQKCESLENRLEQILAELKDAAEFTHQIVMVSLFRNVAFRVTTFFNMILRVSLKWWVGGPLCFNHSKALTHPTLFYLTGMARPIACPAALPHCSKRSCALERFH